MSRRGVQDHQPELQRGPPRLPWRRKYIAGKAAYGYELHKLPGEKG